MTIRRFPDPEALSQAAAEDFAALAADREQFCVALSGGNTPKRLYELLSARQDIDWGKVHLFFGDERYVPPDDPRSNERMVRETLVDRIDIPEGNVHPIYSPDGWLESAERYEKLLRDFFPGGATFDLAIQGMGNDGHTASIFPGQPEPLHGAWVVATQGPADSPQRISLTLECLAGSRELLFLVSGADKAGRLRQVLDGDARYPAARLAAMANAVVWFVNT